MRIPLILSLCLPLLTGGCFVGDGVAHVVKLAAKSANSSGEPVQSAPEAAGAPVDRDPAPPPMAAPRDRIQVEQLPPK